MTRFLHRPMFRVGGSTGQGITSGLAPRQGYKNANRVYEFDELNPEKNKQRLIELGTIDAQGNRVRGLKKNIVSDNTGSTGIKTQSTGSTKPNFEQEMLKQIAGTKIELPRSNTRGNFLTSLGTNILAQPGGQPILQMLGKAAKDPLAQAQSTRSQEGMLKYQHAMSNRDFLLQAWKTLNDEQKTAMQKNIAWLQTEEGGGLSRDEALDRVAGQFRKQMSQEEKDYKEGIREEDFERKQILKIMDDFQTMDKDLSLTYPQARRLLEFKNLADEKGHPFAMDETVFIDKATWKSEGGFPGAIDKEGNITLTKDNVNDFVEGFAYIDITTGHGYYRQGPKLIKIVADEEIISNE